MKLQEEEYLTTKQLSDRIPYAESTIRAFMTKGVLRLGVHYVKPRRRLMFKWTAMKTWVESATHNMQEGVANGVHHR